MRFYQTFSDRNQFLSAHNLPLSAHNQPFVPRGVGYGLNTEESEQNNPFHRKNLSSVYRFNLKNKQFSRITYDMILDPNLYEIDSPGIRAGHALVKLPGLVCCHAHVLSAHFFCVFLCCVLEDFSNPSTKIVKFRNFYEFSENRHFQYGFCDLFWLFCWLVLKSF